MRRRRARLGPPEGTRIVVGSITRRSSIPAHPVSDVPDLCVIVLSYRNETTLPAALDSLAGQGEPLEILVSHSGGPWPRFERPGSVIRVVASEERRTPGA